MLLCPSLTFSPSSRRRSREVLSVLCSSSGPPDSSSCSWSWSWLSSSAPSAVDRDLFRGAFTRPAEQHIREGFQVKKHYQEEELRIKTKNKLCFPNQLSSHKLDAIACPPRYCLCTFDPSDGVLSVLGLMLCGLSLCGVLYRVLVHARVSR